MLSKQDYIVIRIALESQIDAYQKLIDESPESYKGSFEMAKAISEDTLARVNQEVV